MAEFLTTTGTSYYIEQIIINAKETLTMVTPYLKLSKTLLERLTDADRDGVNITLIYGKSELAKNEMDRLSALKNLELWFCENLHAKCFHNEDSMIITSMNLYEFSEKNNREMGILLNRANDQRIFEDALKEINSVRNASQKKNANINKEDSSTYENLIQIPKYYNNENEFCLPSIYKVLIKKYPEFKVNYDSFVTLEDFPERGLMVEISHRVEVFTRDRGRTLLRL